MMMEMVGVEPFSFFYEEPAAAVPPSQPPVDELIQPSEMMFPWGDEALLWEPSPPPAVQRSAFTRYEAEGSDGSGGGGGGGGGRMNIHRRMVEYLRRMLVQKREKGMEYSRSMKHMMRERQRRERLSQCFADLFRMIVPQPKADKSSIVLAAAAYIRSLRSTRDALQRCHQELRVAAQIGGAGIEERCATIKLRVGNPSSPVDSMIAALQRLKSLGVKARSIRSGAGDRELSAAIEVETLVSALNNYNAVALSLALTDH